MASITFEVECEITGQLTGPEPDVGIFGHGVDDLDLSSVCMLKGRRSDGGRKFVWDSFDLLEGLDAKARDIVIGNILNQFGDDASEAFVQDNAE